MLVDEGREDVPIYAHSLLLEERFNQGSIMMSGLFRTVRMFSLGLPLRVRRDGGMGKITGWIGDIDLGLMPNRYIKDDVYKLEIAGKMNKFLKG